MKLALQENKAVVCLSSSYRARPSFAVNCHGCSEFFLKQIVIDIYSPFHLERTILTQNIKGADLENQKKNFVGFRLEDPDSEYCGFCKVLRRVYKKRKYPLCRKVSVVELTYEFLLNWI